MSFGIVRNNDDLKDRYQIKKTPAIIVVKTTEKKPYYYSGDMKYPAIFKFLNIYSETFVPGGGSSQDSAATKNWLTESVPELHFKSANDICLKVEGGICVMILSKGKPDKIYIDALKDAYKSFERKLSRGLTFKFMWLDLNLEPEWGKLYNIEDDLPQVVVLNPGKRKRYLLHEGGITTDSISNSKI